MPLIHSFFVARLKAEDASNAACICCKISPKEWIETEYNLKDEKSSSILSGSSDTSLSAFCFPLGTSQLEEWRTRPPKDFSFTLTGQAGERLHGFCAVVWPEKHIPQVLCLLSTHLYFELFQQVLGAGHELLGSVQEGAPEYLPRWHPMAHFLLEVADNCPALPSPMSSFTANGTQMLLPGDIGNGHWNAGVPIARILGVLSPCALVDVLSAVLLERRCLFVSSSIAMLSMTVHAVSALIYPFRWQHIFLPVLPEGLLDYLEAPMPWIIGLPRSMLPRLEQMALEDVVVVNIDTGKLRMVPQAQQSADCFPWRERICENLQKVLDALDGAPPAEGARPRHAATDSRCCEEGSDTEAVANVLLASVMRDFFLHLLGSYRCFVYELLPGASWLGNTETGPHGGAPPPCPQSALREGNFWFDHDSFLKAQRSSRARRLLSGMRGSQIYEVFVRERLRLAVHRFENPGGDSFEADVAALEHNGGLFSKQRFSLAKLQSASARMMERLKALHWEAKGGEEASSSGRHTREPRPAANPPESGNRSATMRRVVSSEYPAKSLQPSSDQGPLSKTMTIAGRRVGKAAVAVSGRVRKQASSIGNLMGNGGLGSLASIGNGGAGARPQMNTPDGSESAVSRKGSSFDHPFDLNTAKPAGDPRMDSSGSGDLTDCCGSEKCSPDALQRACSSRNRVEGALSSLFVAEDPDEGEPAVQVRLFGAGEPNSEAPPSPMPQQSAEQAGDPFLSLALASRTAGTPSEEPQTKSGREGHSLLDM